MKTSVPPVGLMHRSSVLCSFGRKKAPQSIPLQWTRPGWRGDQQERDSLLAKVKNQDQPVRHDLADDLSVQRKPKHSPGFQECSRWCADLKHSIAAVWDETISAIRKDWSSFCRKSSMGSMLFNAILCDLWSHRTAARSEGSFGTGSFVVSICALLIEAPCSKLQGIFDRQGNTIYSNRSLTPQQAAGNALAPRFNKYSFVRGRVKELDGKNRAILRWRESRI